MSRWPVMPGICALALLGCMGDGPAHRATRPVAEPPPAGASVEGRAIECRAFGHGSQAVLIVGGIHGNEPASATLARGLCAYLDAHPHPVRDRQVLVVPAANPDGLARATRANARGVDLNRNFATANWGRGARAAGPEPMSEPATRLIAGLIRRYRPAAIVQIHQPLACVDWDGPASALAATMARLAGLPARKLGARPGSLGSYAGVDRRIPTVTLELPRTATRLDEEAVWDRYGEALLAAVRWEPTRVTTGREPEIHVHGEMRLRWEHNSE